MENLTSGWRSRWSFNERALVSASIRISSAFLPNVCPHSSPVWRRCQSASLQHIPTTACSHRFFKQGKAKQILHSPIAPCMHIADSRYVPYIRSTANWADTISQEIYVSLSNILKTLKCGPFHHFPALLLWPHGKQQSAADFYIKICFPSFTFKQ